MRHFRQGQNPIDLAGSDRAARHAVIFRFIWILGEDEPASGLECDQPATPVGAGPGQDHANRLRPARFRQGFEQEIERKARALMCLRGRQVERPRANRKIAAGRDDIDVVGSERTPVGCFGHCHRGVLGEQLHHQAWMCRVEMLDENERHACIGREGVEQSRCRFETTC